MTHQSSTPLWYRLWCVVVWVALLSFAASVLLAVPGTAAASAMGGGLPQTTQDVRELLQKLISTTSDFVMGLFAVGVLASAVALIVAVARFMWVRVVRKTSVNASVKTLRPILLTIASGIAWVVILALFGPALGALYTEPTYRLCTLNMQVVVFEDSNGNGIRDVNEPGIPNITVATQSGTPPTARSGETDTSGVAQFTSTQFSCAPSVLDVIGHPVSLQSNLPPDSLMLSIHTPDGYLPASAQSYPFSIRYSSVENVVYVPLRRAS